MFKKVLIANRGEIALRVIRACREMGIQSVAVHSTADTDALHVKFADETVCIGPPPARQSYLNIPAIISAAEVTGADAVHPGYGFLSENADFAEVVQKCGLHWIGPPPEVMRLMGDKVSARAAMAKAGVPILPGTGVIETDDAGRGGGRAHRLAGDHQGVGRRRRPRHEDRREQGAPRRRSWRRRAAEAQAGSATRTSTSSATSGAAPHRGAGRRRRHGAVRARRARVLDPAPPPEAGRGGAVGGARRRAPRASCWASRARRPQAIGYTTVGTLEFLLDEDKSFYFMEMNTRIQVEHTVTEMVIGVDLVREQIRLAAGEPLQAARTDIRPRGHAIECASTPRIR